MANVRKNSPTQLEWHARKLGIDLDNCTEDEYRRAESARKLWYARLQLKSRAGRKAAKARRLREEADRLQAVARSLEALDTEAEPPAPEVCNALQTSDPAPAPVEDVLTEPPEPPPPRHGPLHGTHPVRRPKR